MHNMILWSCLASPNMHEYKCDKCPTKRKMLLDDCLACPDGGHHFCGGCCERTPSYKGLTECPLCPKRRKLAPNTEMQRRIAVEKMNCPTTGCPWKGTVEAYKTEQHPTSCGFQLDPCAGCGDPVLRKDMASHKKDSCKNRKVPCRLCGSSIPAQLLADHPKTCDRALVKCSFEGCGASVARAELARHEQECQTMVECTFEGCGLNVVKAELARHEAECESMGALLARPSYSNVVEWHARWDVRARNQDFPAMKSRESPRVNFGGGTLHLIHGYFKLQRADPPLTPHTHSIVFVLEGNQRPAAGDACKTYARFELLDASGAVLRTLGEVPPSVLRTLGPGES
ncbi:hypothetical protein T484DRAFT_1791944 [Baffinella frigidus]|nr:hypothetical protein T484DRAFT_1791944 [Cryptophyta sp. CCMP2293]